MSRCSDSCGGGRYCCAICMRVQACADSYHAGDVGALLKYHSNAECSGWVQDSLLVAARRASEALDGCAAGED